MEANLDWSLPLMKKFKVTLKDHTNNSQLFYRNFMAKSYEMVEAEVNMLFGTDNVVNILEVED